ncbi:hypothetical protein QE152_g8696 [Popillia japonica]|uniref:Uncharacterized protein n=1 Tax=Popillia japonica TaxID=7064 RepID=A0AAW1LXK1_POPJA
MLAEEMIKHGYNVGLGKEGGERCRQKYHNLMKQYLQIMKNSQRTGAEGSKPLPKYFSLLEKLFGSKHNIHPTYVIDSFTGVGDSRDMNTSAYVTATKTGSRLGSSTSTISTPSTSTTVTPEPEQCNRSRKLKPKSNSEKIIETLKELQQQQIQENQKHFEAIRQQFIQQNEYKKELLNIFRSIAKKRKRSSDSD